MYTPKARFVAKFPFLVMLLILVKQNLLSLLRLREKNFIWYYDISNLILTKIVKNKLLKNIKREFKDRVLMGPFKDMYIDSSVYSPSQIIGMYEHELHTLINNKILKKKYKYLLNIGVANGYYLIGFLKFGNFFKAVAIDIDTYHFKNIKKLLKNNSINCKVSFFNNIYEYNYQSLSDNDNHLVFCDIEGEEKKFLDIKKRDWLKNCDILVEAHSESIFNHIKKNFKHTHKINEIINTATINIVFPNSVKNYNNFNSVDKLVLTGSLRKDKTPWLFLESIKNVS